MMCCGFGHRLGIVYDAHVTANKTLAVGWGPCGPDVSNVFGEMFTATPDIVPNLEPFDVENADCNKHGVQGNAPFFYSKHSLGIFRNLSLNLHPSMQQRLKEFKAEVQWASTPVIGLYVRAGEPPVGAALSIACDIS